MINMPLLLKLAWQCVQLIKNLLAKISLHTPCTLSGCWWSSFWIYHISKQMDADLISRDELISDCRDVFSHMTVTSALRGCASWFISVVERKRWNVWMRERNRTASGEFASYLKVSFAILCRYKSATWFNYSIKPLPAINLHAKISSISLPTRLRILWPSFTLCKMLYYTNRFLL